MIKAFFLLASLLASVQAVADEVKPNPISHTHMKVLAASCAACHGTNGNSVGITPTLAGLDQGYFLSQMLAFKQGERKPTVMHHHAKGLSLEEIHLLAAYFASQPRVTQTVPKSERLKDNHGQ
ncbi:MAG: c-type cytochrome [Methylophilus sp.]|nr:c-type cytochrome [Methylophilus sp.]